MALQKPNDEIEHTQEGRSLPYFIYIYINKTDKIDNKDLFSSSFFLKFLLPFEYYFLVLLSRFVHHPVRFLLLKILHYFLYRLYIYIIMSGCFPLSLEHLISLPFVPPRFVRLLLLYKLVHQPAAALPTKKWWGRIQGGYAGAPSQETQK